MENNTTKKIIGDLFNECFQSMVFKSFGIVKDYDVAKDIVQDVFVRIWQNYEQIRPVKGLKPYVFKAVQNSSFNYLRDQKLNESSKVSITTLNLEYQDDIEEIAYSCAKRTLIPAEIALKYFYFE